MSRRHQASRVTIGTLIEAARKVKRPDLKRLRQMRRNGRELSSEELALVCEKLGADPGSVTWVNGDVKSFMDPLTDPAEITRIVVRQEEVIFEAMPWINSVRTKIVSTLSNGVSKDYWDFPGRFALMNPSLQNDDFYEFMFIDSKKWASLWEYLSRNPALFVACVVPFSRELPDHMRSSDYSLPWLFVRSAMVSLIRIMGDQGAAWNERGKQNLDLAESWQGDDPLRILAARYASALDWVSCMECWEGELESFDEEDSSTWRHLGKRKIGDVQSKDPGRGTVDWASHARVINLILPYFEEMNRLGIFR